MDIETIKETLKKHDNYDIDDPAKNLSTGSDPARKLLTENG